MEIAIPLLILAFLVIRSVRRWIGRPKVPAGDRGALPGPKSASVDPAEHSSLLPIHAARLALPTPQRKSDGPAVAPVPSPIAVPPVPGEPGASRSPVRPADRSGTLRYVRRPPPPPIKLSSPSDRRPAGLDRKGRIRRIVEERGIGRLVHFTPWSNLDTILVDGLLSRVEMQRCGKDGRFVDTRRLDGRLDWISLSISFPNYSMFYRKREELRDVPDWIVIELAPRLLWELDCLFFPTNAASREWRDHPDEELGTAEAFAALFEEPREPELPPDYTTDPQAEVLVRGRVPRDYITGLLVRNRSDPPRLRVRLRELGLPAVRVRYDRSVFEQRSGSLRTPRPRRAGLG